MKLYHMALVVACIVIGAIVGLVAARAFHLPIWIAPALAVANGVSVYFALKRRADARGS